MLCDKQTMYQKWGRGVGQKKPLQSSKIGVIFNSGSGAVILESADCKADTTNKV